MFANSRSPVVLTLRSAWRRRLALPHDHGAWVFLLGPLLIGLFAIPAPRTAWLPVGLVIVAALAAFLLRQPASIAVKALSGRRPRADLAPAALWAGLYGLLGLAALAGLTASGFGFLLLLAAPAAPMFIWHLWLISRRQERRRLGLALVGASVLALAAPAGLWVRVGWADPAGWWLWLLAWLQSAASIVYAYLRLAQRDWPAVPALKQRLRPAWRALACTTANLLLAAGLGVAGWLPPALPLPFAVQWLETIYGALRPAVGARPVLIGLRQLAVSSLFTLLFIVAWRW